MARIALIGVSYNTNSQCEDLVRSLARSSCHDLDIFIVNNSAATVEDNALNGIKKILPGVSITNAPSNPGYLGGARLILERIDPSVYEWVIVANVDIEIADSSFWAKLQKLQLGSDIGIVAPSLVSDLTGGESNPFMVNRPKPLQMAFYRYVFSNFLSSWAYHFAALIKYWIKKKFPGKDAVEGKQLSEVYAPHGAFLIFNREYFRRGGTLRYGAYMYGEEIFIAETCRKLNLHVVFDPDLKVYHRERASTGVVYSKRILTWKKESSLYLWKEFFSGH